MLFPELLLLELLLEDDDELEEDELDDELEEDDEVELDDEDFVNA